MRNPTDTLVLLVTCSRDESRRDLAVDVMKNLAQVVPQAGLQDAFAVFDNASLFDDHLHYAPAGTRIIKSAENVGYWSAIKWVLENRTQIFGRDFKYIYLVESDLYHTDLRPLGACEAFLDATPAASCVRTQEFSVRHRWRYSKRLGFLPFHVTRSEIHLINAVDGNKAWFKSCKEHPNIFLSNLHAKIPALNRISAMETVFNSLAAKEKFAEYNFFEEMMKLYPHIGVWDGGLFYSLISRETAKCMSGSYSSPEALARMGYQQTRYASIVPLKNSPQNWRVKT